jgi:hypothetical protein
MSTQHPITPPPELVRDWARFQNHEDPEALWRRIATLAARWGADQELDAVEDEIITQGWFANSANSEHFRAQLRAARRPKPPSLKEQALEALDMHFAAIGKGQCYQAAHKDTIRLALEALPND